MKTLFLVSFIGSALLFAGQDIDLSTQSASNSTFTPYSTAASFTVDTALHYTDSNLGMAGGLHPCSVMVVGLDCQIIYVSPTDFRLQLFDVNEAGGPNCQMQLAGLTSNYATVRFIHDVVSGQDTCQLTDIAGIQTSTSFTAGASSGTNANYAFLFGGGSGEDIYWAYFRIYNYAFSTSAKPPTTGEFTTGSAGSCSASAANALVYWNFDLCNNTGSLTDISGNGKDAVMSSGSPAYTNSIGQSVVVPVIYSDIISTLPANRQWLPLHPQVGIAFDTTSNHTNHLDGSNSYSQADLTDAVTYSWSALTGPTMPTFTSSTSAIPVVTNLADTTTGHVDYNMQLVATAAGGINTGTATQHIGARPLDANGVVQNSSAVTKIFGPMMALGYNPWGSEDERDIAMSTLQLGTPANGQNIATYNATTVFTTNATGTVSYPFNGKGGFSCTSLSAGISATDVSLNVADVSCLTTNSFPTWIFVGVSGNQDEMIRITESIGTGATCGTGATLVTTGPAKLCVAYDGRGISGGYEFGGGTAVPAQIWPINTLVGEYRIQGSSTQFVTDAARPLCPAGAPGPPGAVIYSTDHVGLTAGSIAVAALGTADFTSIPVGSMIRVPATHNTGTAFIWWARVVTASSHGLTVNRAFPSDGDTASYVYAITGTRYWSLNFCATGTSCGPTDPATNRGLQNAEGCESPTAAFGLFAHDNPAFNGLTFTGVNFSYKENLGSQNASNGPNFYGSGLAQQATFWRSGLTAPYTASQMIDPIWVNDPESGGGWFGCTTLLGCGGGVIGAIADLATNPSTTLTWDNVKEFGYSYGPNGSLGCNAFDTRDSAIQQAFVNLLALFDPDGTRHATWQTYAALWYTRDTATVNPVTGQTGCKQNDNSWANGEQWGAQSPAMDVTMGNASVVAHTAGTFTSGVCNGVQSGTASVSGQTLTRTTGTFQSGSQIILTTPSGTITSFRTGFIVNNSNSITLGGIYPFTSGVAASLNFVITTNDEDGFNVNALAKSNDDPNLQQNYNCTFVDTSHVTLNTPWVGSTDTTGDIFSFKSNLVGYGQQGFFMGGYKASALRWGSLNPDATISEHYTSLLAPLSTWVHDTGYDPQYFTINYGRVYAGCEPATLVSNASITWKVNDCQIGGSLSDQAAAASLNAETTNALCLYYLENIGAPALSYVQNAYAAVWGRSDWTLAGYATNSNYVVNENSNASLSGYKWAGFFFGIGVSHQIPACIAIGAVPQYPGTVNGPGNVFQIGLVH